MSLVTTNQPLGTPTWIDLGIPDLDRATAFYGATFGWEFERGSAEQGYYTMALLDSRRVAALAPSMDEGATEFWWSVYLATDDVDATTERATAAGGTVVVEPMSVMEQGRMAVLKDPVGAQFGLWQGMALVGAELVNQPGTLLRNDLSTPDPAPARAFYAEVFDFSLDGNEDLPGVDFTFLRRPDGHEVGGIAGDPSKTSSAWGTLFQVADVDATVAAVRQAGGTSTDPEDFVYGRTATVHDPFGAEFAIGSPPRS